MKVTNLVLLAISALLSVSALASTLDRVVAIVERTPILASDVTHRLNFLALQAQVTGQAFPADPQSLAPRVLDRLIEEQVLVQEAERQGLGVQDEQINQALAALASRFGLGQDLPQFARAVSAQGLPFEAVRQSVRADILINSVQRAAVRSLVQVSDQEALAVLEREGVSRAEVRLAEILVALPAAPTPAQVQSAQAKALALNEQLAQGAEFSALATQQSDGRQAIEGGDLGWRAVASLPDPFRDAVNQANSQGVTPVFRTRAGFHILRVQERRVANTEIVKEYRVRHVLVRPNAVRDERAARARAETARSRLLSGESFEQVAAELSEDALSASRGGELGWSTTDRYVPNFAQAVESLPIGSISTPVQSRFGWHVIEVMDTRETEKNNEEQLSQARDLIVQRQADEVIAAWTRELVDNTFIERL